MEGIVLLYLVWRRRRALLTAIRNARSEPFVLFILVYTAQVLLLFSVAITNFGLLARQRVMVIPLVLMLLAIPASEDRSLQPRFARVPRRSR